MYISKWLKHGQNTESQNKYLDASKSETSQRTECNKFPANVYTLNYLRAELFQEYW